MYRCLEYNLPCDSLLSLSFMFLFEFKHHTIFETLQILLILQSFSSSSFKYDRHIIRLYQSCTQKQEVLQVLQREEVPAASNMTDLLYSYTQGLYRKKRCSRFFKEKKINHDRDSLDESLLGVIIKYTCEVYGNYSSLASFGTIKILLCKQKLNSMLFNSLISQYKPINTQTHTQSPAQSSVHKCTDMCVYWCVHIRLPDVCVDRCVNIRLPDVCVHRCVHIRLPDVCVCAR